MPIFSSRVRCFSVHSIATLTIVGIGLCAANSASAQTAPTTPPAALESTKVLWHKVPYVAENPDAALADGIRAFNARDWDLAIAAFSKALEMRPRFADDSYNRGLAFLYVKDYDRAISDFTAVIEAKPKLWDARVQRGEALLARGDLQKAQGDAEAVLKVKPDNEYAIDLMKRIRAAQASAR